MLLFELFTVSWLISPEIADHTLLTILILDRLLELPRLPVESPLALWHLLAPPEAGRRRQNSTA